MTHQERFGELRSVLHQPPSPAVWDQLCDLLDGWHRADLVQTALPYAQDHLRSWPDALRVCPLAWIDSLRQRKPHPALPLVRVVNDPHAFNATLSGLAEQPLPLTALRARGYIDHQGVQALARWPSLAGLEMLDLSRCRISSGAVALADGLGPALRQLYLSHCALGDDALQAIVRSPGATKLEVLRLDGNLATDAGVLALAELPCMETLRVLGLGGTDIHRARQTFSAAVMAALVERGVFDGLERLNLSATPLSAAHTNALASARPVNLRALDLSGCQVTTEALGNLLRAPLGAGLRELRLSVNALTSDTGRLLAGLEAPREALDLSYSALGEDGLGDLLAAPWIGQLKTLALANSARTAQVARQLYEHEGLALRELNLSFIPVGDDGAYWISRGSGLAGLTALHLSSCQIGPRGARALASGPSAQTLETLSLSSNPLGEQGLRALAQAAFPALRHLYLEQVELGPRAAEALAAAPWLPQLMTLSIDHHKLSGTARAALADALPARQRLRLLRGEPR